MSQENSESNAAALVKKLSEISNDQSLPPSVRLEASKSKEFLERFAGKKWFVVEIDVKAACEAYYDSWEGSFGSIPNDALAVARILDQLKDRMDMFGVLYETYPLTDGDKIVGTARTVVQE